MTRSTADADDGPEPLDVKTLGKIKRWENKQLDVKSRKAQREEMKLSRKSAKVGAGTVRQCAVTRERKPESQLLRFVLDDQGRVTPDIKRRLPGRGVWITANRCVLAAAMRRGALLRALKAEGSLSARGGENPGDGAETFDLKESSLAGGAVIGDPEELPVVVEALLRRSALSALSLANKAGQVTLGFQAVAKALACSGVAGLIHAAEAAEDGRSKLDRAFAKHMSVEPPDKGVADEESLNEPPASWREMEGSPIVEVFSCEELSSALGKTNVMHAALKKGGASASFLKEAQRLSGYLEPSPAKPPKRRSKQDKV